VISASATACLVSGETFYVKKTDLNRHLFCLSYFMLALPSAHSSR
jgi:hypothetical protein